MSVTLSVVVRVRLVKFMVALNWPPRTGCGA
jgi:hypothetical protein